MGYHSFVGISIIVGALAATATQATAAEQHGLTQQLDEITVKSTRIDETEHTAPLAIGSVGKDEVQLGQQQIGLDESLDSIPGLFFQNRYNFSQDLRISIRGFGAQSSFGIRGIRIITDGIPDTLPDGQSQVDSIDLGSVERIEVIRGPSSALYGSSSGGVINIFSEDGPETPFVSGRDNLGSYGFNQEQLKAGGQYEDLNYMANFSHTYLGGYRQHSAVRNYLVNSKFRYDVDETSDLTVVVNAVDSPEAQDPGALNARELKADRQQAAPRNIQFDAGEELDQQKFGMIYTKDVGEDHAFKLRNYYVWRDFNNKLPFDVNSNGQGGAVDLNRFFLGGGADYAYSGDVFSRENQLVVGFDIDSQQDQRKRFANNDGTLGMLTTNQDEDVTAYGVFLEDRLAIHETLALTFGVRYDDVKYDVDVKIPGATGSGDTSFDEVSPMGGLSWFINPQVTLYGNITTGFETPTTTQLANPDGPTGFNQNLGSQTSTNYEVGFKVLLPFQARFETAFFHIDVDDLLVPFELPGGNQVFYENAATSTNEGIEMSFAVDIIPGLTAQFAYTWSNFNFDSFVDRSGNNFSGNTIPGVPDNLFHSELSYYHQSGFYSAVDLLYVGSFFANNANTVETEAYVVSNIRDGYKVETGNWEISPFIGINNMFNEEYNQNIRLNANFGRFFEPAPKINAYGGITVSFNFD